MLKQLILKPGRERAVQRRHPWVFSGAVAQVIGDPHAGETVEIRAADQSWLARAAYSPWSQIRARIWTCDPNEQVDADFFRRRLEAAREYRRRLGLWGQGASCRLVHGEADGLPGLVIDRYGDFLSCEFLAAGTEHWKAEIVAALAEMGRDDGIRGIFERSEADSRRREGLEEATGVLWGQEPPEPLAITENGLELLLDLQGGHKTGFYLDQRENRLAIDAVAPGAQVLDCCCYSGAFGIRAARAGAASVLFMDSSAAAIDLARRNAERNGLAGDARLEFLQADMFTQLRQFRDSRRSFDVIVLDPPKFAATQGQLPRAVRGYKDINLLACKLLREHGTLLTFSCSAAMTPELFRTIVAEALCDAGRAARVVRSFSQAEDHPASLAFPEGQYLTGLQLALD